MGSSGQTALSFVIVNPAISTVVSGIRAFAHPEDVVGVTDVRGLPEGRSGNFVGCYPSMFTGITGDKAHYFIYIY
jgi:hypothetical protein